MKTVTDRRSRGVYAAIGLMLAAAALTVLPQSTARAQQADETVDVQILGFNDFHGQLDQPTGNIGGQAAGGIEYFASAVKSYRALNPNTVVVSAGDMIGASPLTSGLFHDEPTIEAMNNLGLDFEGVGNHNFDEGVTELLRMQNGGCHPVDGCQDGDAFGGASFEFLSANVRNATTHETVFPAYGVKEFGGVKVAFIGVTLEGTPAIVSPAGIQGYEFLDEADTVNALVPELQAQGIHTIIVLVHQSAGSGGSGQQGFNGCNSSSNTMVSNFDPEIDAVVSGHSHTAYNCLYNGRPVTQAGSQGKLITQLNMTLSTSTGQPVSMEANNRIVARTVTPDADALALLTKYRNIAMPIANEVQGTITGDLRRGGGASPAGEQPLGDVIADSHLWGTQSEGAQIAFMNTGGIRTDLLHAQISAGEQPGEVTYGELFTVQPFGNNLETVTMTGLQIKRVLEQQFQGGTGILQVSKSLTYTQDRFKPVGERINPDKMLLNGVKMDMNAEYRVAGNSFLIDGGDNYTVFAEGTNRTGGMVDNDATAAYFDEFSPIAPPVLDRITRIDTAAPVATAEPTITGTPKVGQTLTAHPAVWPAEGVSTFSWTVDGAEVGSGTTYDVAPGDLGKKVRLVETLKADRTEDGISTADSATITEGGAPAPAKVPSILGTAVVGSTLTVTGGTWPRPGTSTYTWSVNGSTVGSGTSYQLTPADAGKAVMVTETFSSAGYASATASTAAGIVADATVTVVIENRKAKKGKEVKVVITLTSPGLTVPGRVKLTYAGERLGAVKLKDGKAIVKLPAHRAGRYKLTVSYAGSTGFSGAEETVKLKVK